MNRFILVLSVLLIISPLFGQEEIDLTSDTALTTIFNKNEIEGLKSMVQYVDDMVLNSTMENNIDKAYHLFFEEISQATAYKPLLKEEVKYQFLESMDSSVFNAIWRFGSRVDMIHYRDTVYRDLENFKSLELKPFSRYMDYLKEIGKEDAYFKYLQQEFEGAGNLTKDSSEWFPKNHANFDFSIPKNRLWATIYLLRMEETYEMKLDRYFKNR